MASSPSSAAPRWDARTWALLVVLCGVLFLDGLDVSMVGMALPSIRSELGLTTSQLQWVVSGYVLGYGGLLLLGGRAADLLGRKRVLIAGLVRVRRRLGDRRPRQRRHAARPHPRHQGHERGVHRARRPLDHHHHVRGGPEPQPGARVLHRHRRERLLARARARRPAHRARLALDVPAPGPVRAGDPRPGAARDPARQDPAGREAALRHRGRGDDHGRDAPARAHGGRGARGRLDRSRDDRRVRPRRRPAGRVRGDRAAQRPAARAARHPALRPAGARQPRHGDDVRRLRRLPVRRDALPPDDARLVAGRDRARVPAGRPPGGARVVADRAARRPLRHGADHRGRHGGLRGRLRAVPALRRLAVVRRSDAADDAVDRVRLRARVPEPEHPGGGRHPGSRAGPGLRPRQHLVPARRRDRPGDRHGGGERRDVARRVPARDRRGHRPGGARLGRCWLWR